MPVNSILFFLFLAIVALVYYAVHFKKRWLVLLAASLLFYAINASFLLLIPISIATITFAGAHLITKSKKATKKFFLLAAVLISLAILFAFKYPIFSNTLVFLPLGISFYTFAALSYVFEVYRKNMKVEKNFGKYLLFVMFFPLVSSGPIERANRLLPQLKRLPNFKYGGVTSGLKLIAWGLFKKLVIADRLAIVVDQIYKNPNNYSGFPLLLATVFFAYQLYCDFSGYSDIARGTASVFGINVMNNFNYPYAAKSISDFWRRWHISLSSYLREYVYTPVALFLRGWGIAGIIAALSSTFILIGFWHGANWTFGIFGALQAVAISIEVLSKKWRKKLFKSINPFLGTAIATLSTFVFWCFSLIFFRAANVTDAKYVISHMFVYVPLNQVLSKGLGLSVLELIMVISSVLVLELVQFMDRRKNLLQVLNRQSVIFRFATYYALILAILLFGKFGQGKFIYFNF